MNITEAVAIINRMQADGIIGRYARLLQFMEAGALDAGRFQAIVTRHGLAERWRQFERLFLHDQP